MKLFKNKKDVDMFLKSIAKVFGFLSYKRIASGLDTGSFFQDTIENKSGYHAKEKMSAKL